MFRLTVAQSLTYLVLSVAEVIEEVQSHSPLLVTSVAHSASSRHLPVGMPALSYMYRFFSPVHQHQLYVAVAAGSIAKGLVPLQSAAVSCVLLVTLGPTPVATPHQVAVF